jgi:hypothetical protein
MNTNAVPESRRFDDATRSFGENLTRWRTQPALRLVTMAMLLLLLAVAVACISQALTEWHPDLDRFVNTMREYWEYDRS